MVGWGGGGPCDYCVSLSPSDLDFGTLDFRTSDSGLTKSSVLISVKLIHSTPLLFPIHPQIENPVAQ